MPFNSLGLAEPILRAIAREGYTEPTPIQEQAIPAALEGRDVLAAAQTGTGKTAGFTLPILQLLSEEAQAKKPALRALILTPTRELAAQIAENIEAYSHFLKIRSAVVFGGVNINPQINTLKRGVDILVATPGRLLDLHGQGKVNFRDLEILVLDEADRMLDMGFIHDIKRILKLLPAKRQNLLFSATFSSEIRKLTQNLLHNPVRIDVTPKKTAAETVEQSVYLVDKKAKTDLLCKLIHDGDWRQVLVFTRTKHGANRLAEKLERDGIHSAAIHGNKSQGARTRALAGFKQGDVRALVATDIAARGLDIEQLPQVVNFELPNVPEDYVHRIGRTGRAGQSGAAVSLVSADERPLLKGIENLLRTKLPSETLPGFEQKGDNGGQTPDKSIRPPARRSSGRGSAGARSGRPAGQRSGNRNNSRRN